jgi:multidrug/hemolysin transport system permease protein
MISLAKRNIKLFFRDKSAVFFSLLSVFIIIGLYVFFLGDAWVSSFDESMPNPEVVMGSWIMAGLLAVTSVTTTMGVFGTMVEDKSRDIYKDFVSSPIKRSSLTGGYIISSYVVGMIMCLVTLVLAEAYILYCGGELLSLWAILKVIGILVVLNFTSTCMVMLFVTLFSSRKAFGTASTVLGTLIGFLTGIYLPIGQLPEGVQTVVKAFPITHGAALLRQIMMKVPMSVTFANVPAEYVQEFEEELGVTLSFGNSTVSPAVSIAILVVSGALFFILAAINMSRKER